MLMTIRTLRNTSLLQKKYAILLALNSPDLQFSRHLRHELGSDNSNLTEEELLMLIDHDGAAIVISNREKLSDTILKKLLFKHYTEADTKKIMLVNILNNQPKKVIQKYVTLAVIRENFTDVYKLSRYESTFATKGSDELITWIISESLSFNDENEANSSMSIMRELANKHRLKKRHLPIIKQIIEKLALLNKSRDTYSYNIIPGLNALAENLISRLDRNSVLDMYKYLTTIKTGRSFNECCEMLIKKLPQTFVKNNTIRFINELRIRDQLMYLENLKQKFPKIYSNLIINVSVKEKGGTNEDQSKDGKFCSPT